MQCAIALSLSEEFLLHSALTFAYEKAKNKRDSILKNDLSTHSTVFFCYSGLFLL
jgi:hypothetical protein